MAKVTKGDLFFLRTAFIILLSLLCFMVGYVVGITRLSNTAEKPLAPQIRIIPNTADEKPEAAPLIHAGAGVEI
jgi:hypothetical protein